VDGYPGLIRDVQTYLKERIREVLTGSSDTVVVRIYGPELEVLREKADEVRDASTESTGCGFEEGAAHGHAPVQVEWTWPRPNATG